MPNPDLLGDEIRRTLPVKQYVQMLHIAASTGVMPICNEDGEVTSQGHEIDGKQRREIAQYLVDKAVANAKPEAATADVNVESVLANLKTISTLPTHELTKLLAALAPPTGTDPAGAKPT